MILISSIISFLLVDLKKIYKKKSVTVTAEFILSDVNLASDSLLAPTAVGKTIYLLSNNRLFFFAQPNGRKIFFDQFQTDNHG